MKLGGVKMALNQTFDLNRITDVENTQQQNSTALTNRLDKTNNAKQGIPNIDVTGTANCLTMTQAVANSTWFGLMDTPSTYDYAMGRFNANSHSVELRAYQDVLTIRTGRKAGCVNADLNIITNDQATAGVSQDINLLSRGTVRLCPDNGGLKTNGFNVILLTNGMPCIQSINTAISDTMLKFGAGVIQAKNNADTVFIPFNASAFNVVSERSYKEEIEECKESVLQKILKTPVRLYKLKGDKTKTKRMGLIRDESPEQIQDSETVDLYQMTTMLWKAVQELTAKIERLEPQVEEKGI
jgi:hypothetical protein